MDETVPMLYRSYPRSLDRLTFFADVMTKVAHSSLLLFKTLCVGPVWPLHQKRLSPFQQTVVRPKKGAVTTAKEEKSSWARRNSERWHTLILTTSWLFFPSWGTWPERSWVLTDTARECSHACHFWEGVFSLEKMGVILKKNPWLWLPDTKLLLPRRPSRNHLYRQKPVLTVWPDLILNESAPWH